MTDGPSDPPVRIAETVSRTSSFSLVVWLWQAMQLARRMGRMSASKLIGLPIVTFCGSIAVSSCAHA